MLEEKVYVSAIEPLPDGQIQVRTTTAILKNAMKTHESHHRHVLKNGDDLSGEAPEVKAVANILWTSK